MCVSLQPYDGTSTRLKEGKKRWFGKICGQNYRKVLSISEQGQDKVNDAPEHENWIKTTFNIKIEELDRS